MWQHDKLKSGKTFENSSLLAFLQKFYGHINFSIIYITFADLKYVYIHFNKLFTGSYSSEIQ